MIAAVLESGDPRRLYTGLSLLVSAAVEGEDARALVMFGALAPLLDEDLATRAATGAEGIADGATFGRSLAELRDAALALETCRVEACAAAVELTGADWATVQDKLDGVVSTPRWLREVADARLVVV